MPDHSIPKLKELFSSGRIGRRQFMSGAIYSGLTVTLASAVADRVQAATPRRGGHLNVGHAHGATSDSRDPGHFENGFQNAMTFGYNGYLTKVGLDGTVQPDLAESWESTPDATQWTFRIREAEFHNGRTVTAQDVVTSLNHHRGEKSTSAAKPLMSAVRDIRADGDRTIVVTLDAGNADFPFIVTDYHMPVMQDDDGRMDWKSMIGCGAYKVDHYEPGRTSELSRHENHWSDDVAFFDTVQQIALIDPNARTSALVAGDVDVIDRIDLKTAGLLGRRPGVNIHSTTGTQHYTMPMRCDTPPFDDVNVRRALKHAINRQELLDKILFGYGEVGNDIPIGSNQRFYNSNLPQTEYDPDKARHYLKEAGLDSLSVSLSSSETAFAGAIDAAVLYQASAAKCGIDINVVREPNDGYWSDVWMKKPWCVSYFGGRPVEDMTFSTMYESTAAWNDSFWKNDRFDSLLVQARAELDEDRRREMYHEMQAILHDDGGVVIPLFAAYVFAMNDSIGHTGEFASNWDLDGERFMERWWKV